MISKRKVLAVVGTRPEAIKMAPVIKRLQREPWAEVCVVATAQHRDLLDRVLDVFEIAPDVDLDIMQPGQGLMSLTSRLLHRLDGVLRDEQPDVVLAQGDTTTTMAAAMGSFYHRIPFGHVEAGLRTGDMDNPFPEEMNRVVAGRLAQWNFAPTQSACDNLLAEGVSDNHIDITGNTVIDALLDVAGRAPPLAVPVHPGRRLVLVTTHRRENFGEPLREICRALRDLVLRHPDVEMLFPVHPNPNVRPVVDEFLGAMDRVHLVEPLDYLPFVAAMKRAHLIISDSGGVQEEAPALAKPVLVLRHETERPEAVEMGVVKLVGTRYSVISREADRLLTDDIAYRNMARGVSPYGDGRAAQRIVDCLKRHFVAGQPQPSSLSVAGA